MATTHRIMLGEVRRHLKHCTSKRMYAAIYRKAGELAVACGNPEIFNLVCEAIDVGSRNGIYSYYADAPKSKGYK